MSNSTWWKDKLAANVARDLSVTKALTRAGWVVLRFWEHEDIGKIVKSVSRTVSTRSGF
jgi:DNA mismatch endonuclease (patch repair protein)